MAKNDHKPGPASPAKPPPGERRLTVSEFPDYPPSKRVPTIRLKGRWLAHAGFAPTHAVRVRVMNGCIVITLD